MLEVYLLEKKKNALELYHMAATIQVDFGKQYFIIGN